MLTENLSSKGNFIAGKNMPVANFVKPHEITKDTNIHTLLPEINDIPIEFANPDNKWHKAVLTGFFAGINKNRYREKSGIDKNKAITHLSFVISDWGLIHEHKISGAAYLMSLWFDDVVLI
jgi:hypothetical protein